MGTLAEIYQQRIPHLDLDLKTLSMTFLRFETSSFEFNVDFVASRLLKRTKHRRLKKGAYISLDFLGKGEEGEGQSRLERFYMR